MHLSRLKILPFLLAFIFSYHPDTSAEVLYGVGLSATYEIDATSNTITNTIPTGGQSIAITPDENFIYIAQPSTDTVAVVNRCSKNVIATVPVGDGPNEIAITPNGLFAYVTNVSSGTVSVIDLTINTVIATVPVGTLPHSVAITPDNLFAYVTNAGTSTVSVISTETNTVISTINLGGTTAGDIAITPNGLFAYVLGGSQPIVVIDTTTNTVTTTISGATAPAKIVISPNGLFAYVSDGTNVQVISTATNTISTTVPVPATNLAPIAITADGLHVYVGTDFANTNVFDIDTTTNTIQDTITTGFISFDIAVTNVVVTLEATATPSGDTICSGQTPNISLSSNIADTSFSWTVVQTNVTGASNGTGNVIAQPLTATTKYPGTAVYTVTPAAVGCNGTPYTGTPVNVIITVNPLPVATATPSTATICSGTNPNIVLTSNVAGTTFSWTVVQNNVTGASSGSGATLAQTLTATSTIAGTATYTITPSANGCAGTPITVVINVNPTPTIIATPPSDQIFSNTSTNITLTSNLADTTFSWTVVQNNVTGASAGTGNSIAQVLTTTTNAAGTATYTITPTANGCVKAPINVVITVKPIPDAIATPPIETINSVQSTNIALSSNSSDTTFSWTVTQTDVTGASDGSGNSLNQLLIATSANPGTATYTITPSVGDYSGTPIIVVVNVIPNIVTPNYVAPNKVTQNILFFDEIPSIPLPPSNFVGFEKKNNFLSQTELTNVLSWTASIDPSVTSYKIYQNAILVATVPASGPYEIVLHNRKKALTYTYELTAVNDSGESSPLVVVLP